MSRVLAARDAFLNECTGDPNGGLLFRTIVRLFLKLTPKERIIEHMRTIATECYDQEVAPDFPLDNQGRRLAAHYAGKAAEAILADV